MDQEMFHASPYVRTLTLVAICYHGPTEKCKETITLQGRGGFVPPYTDFILVNIHWRVCPLTKLHFAPLEFHTEFLAWGGENY